MTRQFTDSQGVPTYGYADTYRATSDADYDAVIAMPAGVAIAMMLDELYHATLDAFTQPEPRAIIECSDVSRMMLTTFAMPEAGRELGRYVQRWRDDTKTAALLGLRAALVKIEQEKMNDDD